MSLLLEAISTYVWPLFAVSKVCLWYEKELLCGTKGKKCRWYKCVVLERYCKQETSIDAKYHRLLVRKVG